MANHHLAIRSQMLYNSINEKILDKIEIDGKIVNRTNVCYERRKLMNDTLENLLKKATEEQLIKLMLIAESIVQQDLRTVPSVHQSLH